MQAFGRYYSISFQKDITGLVEPLFGDGRARAKKVLDQNTHVFVQRLTWPQKTLAIFLKTCNMQGH